ncbi:MAG TPA: hypothetical protein VMH05_20910 [Bryobacteraceae bacterium]|nr:hypothetical protein [Bryobacteraceae bacterium]
MYAAIEAAVQSTTSVVRNWRIWFILTSLVCAPAARAADPPPDLARRVAARETETAQVESNYAYRQSFSIGELTNLGTLTGEYREVRDIIFSPQHERIEQVVGKPSSTLSHLKLTDEDFRDIREVQPFLLTKDQAFLYETTYRGEETVDGIDCFVLRIRPRQILDGQRLFDGMLWVAEQDYSIIRSAGQAVPQIQTTRTENLFPHFTTVRQKMESGFWFPAATYADDTLPFRNGPQRIRLTIRYSDYRKFGADSKITYQK